MIWALWIGTLLVVLSRSALSRDKNCYKWLLAQRRNAINQVWLIHQAAPAKFEKSCVLQGLLSAGFTLKQILSSCETFSMIELNTKMQCNPAEKGHLVGLLGTCMHHSPQNETIVMAWQQGQNYWLQMHGSQGVLTQNFKFFSVRLHSRFEFSQVPGLGMTNVQKVTSSGLENDCSCLLINHLICLKQWQWQLRRRPSAKQNKSMWKELVGVLLFLCPLWRSLFLSPGNLLSMTNAKQLCWW